MWGQMTLRERLLEQERRIKKGPIKKKKSKITSSYTTKDDDVIKPKKDKKTFGERLDKFSQITGINPFSYFTDTPTTPDLDVPDLASEVRSRVEQQKARIASSPKMYPFYFERAKQGKFVKAKCKLGKNKKTKLL